MIEVIDDFLRMDESHLLHEQLTGNYFPWFYQTDRETEGDGNYQLTHLWQDAWIYEENNGWNSGVTENLFLLLNRLPIKKLWRVKANLQPPVDTIEPCVYHTDPPPTAKNITTAVYYVTNGGYTEFETGEKIKSISNRLVMFPSELKHRGSTSTDARVVININFER
jgi:hypothetical protein